MEETNTAPETEPTAPAKKTEQPLSLGIAVWTFPIWWPFLYLFILSSINFGVQSTGVALYQIVPPFILLFLYLSGFFFAYMISLAILNVSVRIHLYNLIIWSVLSGVLMMLSGMSETTLTMTFAQAAGCPHEALMRYTRP